MRLLALMAATFSLVVQSGIAVQHGTPVGLVVQLTTAGAAFAALLVWNLEEELK